MVQLLFRARIGGHDPEPVPDPTVAFNERVYDEPRARRHHRKVRQTVSPKASEAPRAAL